jgi:hypothetical protein
MVHYSKLKERGEIMAKVFYPQVTEYVDASCPPHPLNTRYKISIGQEDWDSTFVTVAKVQMEYDGVVSGRRSPSFPMGTDDLKKVNEKIEQMVKEYESNKK